MARQKLSCQRHVRIEEDHLLLLVMQITNKYRESDDGRAQVEEHAPSAMRVSQ
jgi:hypothetical protein